MPSEAKYEERALLEMLANDSEYAFQLLFDHHRNKVYRIAMLYVKSPVLAEDIVQDVFLKLWFQRKNILQLESLESWIYTLTKNLTINCLKKLAHEWNARSNWAKGNLYSENTTDHKVRNSEYQKLVLCAIDHLPEQQQKVYRLAKEKGLSYDVIAQQLSISALTVKTHMYRALASIRAYLQQHGKDFVLLFLLSRPFF